MLRTAEGKLEEDDTPILATYTRSAVELEQRLSRTLFTMVKTASKIDIRPIKGRLLTLGGLLYPLEPGAATLLLITALRAGAK